MVHSACDSMAMLIGTAALCSEHLKRMAPGAGYHPAHRQGPCSAA